MRIGVRPAPAGPEGATGAASGTAVSGAAVSGCEEDLTLPA
jgi:hypothetical protein